MSASTGDFVTPGNQVEVPAGASLGSGLSETESGAIALVSGTFISDGDTISVDANRPETNSPQIGDDVIAEVTKLMPKVAMIRILHIEKDAGIEIFLPRICLPTFSSLKSWIDFSLHLATL